MDNELKIKLTYKGKEHELTFNGEINSLAALMIADNIKRFVNFTNDPEHGYLISTEEK